jgi:hypothetical protein
MYSNPPLTLGGGAVAGGTTAAVSGTPAGSSLAHGHVLQAAGNLASLPFTGLNLVWLVIAAFSLIAAGLALMTLTAPVRHWRLAHEPMPVPEQRVGRVVERR